MPVEDAAKSGSLASSVGKALEVGLGRKFERAFSTTRIATRQTPDSSPGLFSKLTQFSESSIIPHPIMTKDIPNDIKISSSEPSLISDESYAGETNEVKIEPFSTRESEDESGESDADDTSDEDMAIEQEEVYNHGSHVMSDFLNSASIAKLSEVNIGTSFEYPTVKSASKSPVNVPSPNLLQTPYGKQMAASKNAPSGPIASTSYAASNAATAAGMYAKYANQTAVQLPTSHTTSVSAFSHAEAPKTLEGLLRANWSNPKFGQATALGSTRLAGVASNNGAQKSATSPQYHPEVSSFGKWTSGSLKTSSSDAGVSLDELQHKNSQPTKSKKKPATFTPGRGIGKKSSTSIKMNGEKGKTFSYEPSFTFGAIADTGKPFAFGGKGLVQNPVGPLDTQMVDDSMEKRNRVGLEEGSTKPISTPETDGSGMKLEEDGDGGISLSSLGEALAEVEDASGSAGMKGDHSVRSSTKFQHDYPINENCQVATDGERSSRIAELETLQSSQASKLVHLTHTIDDLREQIKTLTSEKAQAQLEYNKSHAKVLEEKISLEDKLYEKEGVIMGMRLESVLDHLSR